MRIFDPMNTCLADKANLMDHTGGGVTRSQSAILDPGGHSISNFERGRVCSCVQGAGSDKAIAGQPTTEQTTAKDKR